MDNWGIEKGQIFTLEFDGISRYVKDKDLTPLDPVAS
jgi:hypothetical protein